MTGVEATADEAELGWRERAMTRTLNAARERAEVRSQRLLDAALELIDEKGTTEFTIHELIERSKQSLRSFYEYFDSKEELILALFEETVRAADEDIRAAVDAETEPLARLRAFTIRLHQWCDPWQARPGRGTHHLRAISEFSMRLAPDHSERIRAALVPMARLLRELISAANDAGAICVADDGPAATLVQQTVMNSWFGNRLVQNPKHRLTGEETWDFCLRALGG